LEPWNDSTLLRLENSGVLLFIVGVCMMPLSPSIVPSSDDHDIYLVLDDLGGRLGRIWREANEKDTDRATLIRYLLEGQYSNPARVVAFNTDEGLARDASAEVAGELWERLASYDEMPATLADFISRYAGPGGGRQLELLL
jgi:hypothetical protein